MDDILFGRFYCKPRFVNLELFVEISLFTFSFCSVKFLPMSAIYSFVIDTEQDDKVDFGKVSSYLSSDIETTDQSLSCSSMVANLNEEIQIVRVIANPTSNTVSVIQPGPFKQNPEQNPETPSNGANSSGKGNEVDNGEAFRPKEESEKNGKSEKNSRKRKRTVEQNAPFHKNEFTCVTCGIHFTKHFELIMHLLQKHKAELEELKNQQLPNKAKDTQNLEQHIKGN